MSEPLTPVMFSKRRQRREAARRAEAQLQQARAAEAKAAEEQDAEKNAHLHELQTVLSQLMQDNASLEADRDTLEEELEAVRLSMGARLRGLESAHAQAQNELRDAASERENLQRSAREAQADMGSQIAELTSERVRNRATIDDLEAQLDAAAEISAEDQHTAEQTEARLVTELDAALRSGRERAEALEENLVVASSELEAAKVKLTKAQENLSNVVSRARLEKVDLLQRIDTLQCNLTACEAEARDMETAARKSESDAREAMMRADIATERLHTITARMELCEMDRNDLQEALRRGGFEGTSHKSGGASGRDGMQEVDSSSVVVHDADASNSQVLLLETQLRSQQRKFDAAKSALERQLSDKTSEVDALIARQVAFEAEIAERDGALQRQNRQVQDLEGACARLEKEKSVFGEKARRLSDELSDFKVAAEFEVMAEGRRSVSNGASGSDDFGGFRIGNDAFDRFSFEIVRKIEVTFEDEPSSLGVGLAQMARGSQLTVIRTINEGTKSKPTGAGVHNQGGDEANALEPGMALLGINRVSTVSMSYEDVITAIKRLPRPISLLFGVIQLEKVIKDGS